jgi:hypothetical protein
MHVMRSFFLLAIIGFLCDLSGFASAGQTEQVKTDDAPTSASIQLGQISHWKLSPETGKYIQIGGPPVGNVDLPPKLIDDVDARALAQRLAQSDASKLANGERALVLYEGVQNKRVYLPAPEDSRVERVTNREGLVIAGHEMRGRFTTARYTRELATDISGASLETIQEEVESRSSLRFLGPTTSGAIVIQDLGIHDRSDWVLDGPLDLPTGQAPLTFGDAAFLLRKHGMESESIESSEKLYASVPLVDQEKLRQNATLRDLLVCLLRTLTEASGEEYRFSVKPVVTKGEVWQAMRERREKGTDGFLVLYY